MLSSSRWLPRSRYFVDRRNDTKRNLKYEIPTRGKEPQCGPLGQRGKGCPLCHLQEGGPASSVKSRDLALKPKQLEVGLHGSPPRLRERVEEFSRRKGRRETRGCEATAALGRRSQGETQKPGRSGEHQPRREGCLSLQLLSKDRTQTANSWCRKEAQKAEPDPGGTGSEDKCWKDQTLLH